MIDSKTSKHWDTSLAQFIIEMVKRQMNTKSINAAIRRNPFKNNPAGELRVWESLSSKQTQQEIPTGYGFADREYEPIEPLPLGSHRAKKYINIILPEQVWNPRTVLWVQALESLYEILDH